MHTKAHGLRQLYVPRYTQLGTGKTKLISLSSKETTHISSSQAVVPLTHTHTVYLTQVLFEVWYRDGQTWHLHFLKCKQVFCSFFCFFCQNCRQSHVVVPISNSKWGTLMVWLLKHFKYLVVLWQNQGLWIQIV
jgi:hypothetical protein